MVRLKLLILLHRHHKGLIGTAGPAVEGDWLDVTEPMQPTMKDRLKMAHPYSIVDIIVMYSFIFMTIAVAYISIRLCRSRRRDAEKSVV